MLFHWFWGFVFHVLVHFEYVCHIADGDISGRVNVMSNIFHFTDLEPVQDDIDHVPVSAGIKALGGEDGHTLFKLQGQRLADLHLLGGNDQRRLGTIQAFYDKVHGC